MGNLLDNCIESCILSSNKEIFLKAHCFNQSFIVITLINSCDKKPPIKNGDILTTKKNITEH